MATLFLAVSLLTYHPFAPEVGETRVELIELNHVYIVDGDELVSVLDQVIFWTWEPWTLDLDEGPAANAYRVLAWRMVNRTGMIPRRHRSRWRCLWTEGTGVLSVTAPKFVESWTLEDIEVADRRVLPMADRRGLAALDRP
jgi:hypothetical protein